VVSWPNHLVGWARHLEHERGRLRCAFVVPEILQAAEGQPERRYVKLLSERASAGLGA